MSRELFDREHIMRVVSVDDNYREMQYTNSFM
jgi:hypothetical protein